MTEERKTIKELVDDTRALISQAKIIVTQTKELKTILVDSPYFDNPIAVKTALTQCQDAITCGETGEARNIAANIIREVGNKTIAFPQKARNILKLCGHAAALITTIIHIDVVEVEEEQANATK